MKPVNLTVHRNTRERKKRHEASNFLVKDAKRASAGKNIDGYVIVTWDKEQAATPCWKCGSVPQRSLPDFVRGVLQSKFSMDDAEYVVWGDDDAS